MADTGEGPREPGFAGSGWLRALGTMLGVHVEYAQREVSSDLRRLFGAAVLLVLAAIGTLLALGGLHAALIIELHREFSWRWSEACAVVALGDLLITLVLLVMARMRLRSPVLVETRALVRRTVASLTEP